MSSFYSLQHRRSRTFFFFFFNDTATTEIYTLSLHDALPISLEPPPLRMWWYGGLLLIGVERSEEHTSELQSQSNLVCRLLLEKKKKNDTQIIFPLDHCCTLISRSLRAHTPSTRMLRV